MQVQINSFCRRRDKYCLQQTQLKLLTKYYVKTSGNLRVKLAEQMNIRTGKLSLSEGRSVPS